MRELEQQKLEQDKVIEEKEKEVEGLNQKLKEMQHIEPREEQPPAEHAPAENATADQEELARIKKLEEALRELQQQKQQLTESLKSQQEATIVQEKLVDGKAKELETLNLKLKELQTAGTQDEPEEPEGFAEVAAKKAVSQWVESASHEEWLSQWDSENVSLTVPVVMTSGVHEHGPHAHAPSRVGLKGADFFIQPLLPAGPPQRLKLSSVKSIIAEQSQPDAMSQSVSLLLDVDEGGRKRQFQMSSDEESAEAILATLTRDVRVMPGAELKGQ